MPNHPRFPPMQLRPVEVLAFPGVQVLDVTGPLQVFASANEHVARFGGVPPYRLQVVAKDGGSVTSSAGLALATEPLVPVRGGVDTLIIAGGPGVEAAAADCELIDWLRRRAEHSRRVASVCTGAFILAASGALDGRRAVTHWSYCEEFARRFPAVRVEADPIFLHDDAVWTSAGVTAGIDLALALVEEDLGRETALAVARYLVVFLKRPGGQAQFSAALSLQTAGDRFGALHRWMRANIGADLSLPVLAAEAGMSERSFSRRYLEETGVTPARAAERLRVEAARQMLAETRHPVKRIAQRCGFGSEETMRRSFLRLLAITPHDYRSRFGTDPQAAGNVRPRKTMGG
ncbi:GlxA family transcriptional regulator [Methylobacterium durans]|uniref:AraC family transcriptional regulator n=1 Tax=Methylobacterium durans TaxID=2202825 RepID=A0A2U8WG00_9HYPH|nr:GlxA family transcriptional regulator [Methylobacterium durans]AWN44468.1 AraC family transcriptional regulator [Methylobacterium durans]